MTRLTWLADVLRDAGLTVVEHKGWQTHARPGAWSPTYGVIHATAAPRTQPDDVQVRIVRDGRSDLPGPIANACVDRQGRWHVLSAGRCNSTLTGTGGPYKGHGNTGALSTEACNDNGLHSPPEEWPEVQYRAYVRGWAAWCRRLGWTPDRLVGHREHTPGRKSDPTFSMSQFRRDVAAVLAGEDDMTPAQFLAILKDPAVARQMRALPWQYEGGGIPKGMSTLGVLDRTYATVRALGEAIAHESASPEEIRALLADLPAPPSAEQIGDEVLAGLGGRSPADVAQALVAAGIDPVRLADELRQLAEPDRARHE